MNRRHFLRNSSFTILAGAGGNFQSLRALEADNVYRNAIGLQLYTLRNELKVDTVGTIKAVAKLGYKQVEPYGFPNASDMISAAKDSGMAVNSSHFEWKSVLDAGKKGVQPFEEILSAAKEAGLSHLVVPYLEDFRRKDLDGYKNVAEKCNLAAEQAKAAGIQLSYHNHAFEFEPMDGGKTGFDVLIDEFSPDMKFELDVFWVKVGGREPTEMIKKLKGRVSQLHLKDLKKDISVPEYGQLDKDAFQELGDGMIDMEPIIVAAKAAGVKLCHVEQDHSPDPLASVEQSMTFLKSL